MMRLLIVDDEKLFLESIAEHIRLRRKDIEVYSATSPIKAFSLLKEKDIQIIVTDLKMDDIDGLTFLSVVRNKYPYLGAIVMTAYGSPSIKEKVLSQVGVRYIAKPFSIEEFERELELLLKDIGNIKHIFSGYSLLDILQLMNKEKRSGIININYGKNSGKVWVKNGKIIHATCRIDNKSFVGITTLVIQFQWISANIKILPYEEPIKYTISSDSKLVLKALNELKKFTRKQTDENKSLIEALNTLKANNFIERFKDDLSGLWLINRTGKVIYSRVYEGNILNFESSIEKSLMKYFFYWKNGNFDLKSELKEISYPHVLIVKQVQNFLAFLYYKYSKYRSIMLHRLYKKGGKSMPSQKDMEKALELLRGIEGNEGAAIVSDEGLVLEATLDKKYNPDKVGALISVVLEAAEKVMTETGWGVTDNFVLEGENGKMVLYKIPIGFIVLFGRKDMSLGLARVQVDEAAKILGG